MKKDRIFDGLAVRFSERIYGNPKGWLRLELVQDDIRQNIDVSSRQKILDVGGGLGQMSLWLAEQGCQVTLAEPSVDMRRGAEEVIEKKNLTGSISVSSLTLQEFSKKTSTGFDLVIFHAVLEWLSEPELALVDIDRLLTPNGYVSLMFYNHHSAVMRSLMVADFDRVSQDRIAAMGDKGFTPISPLEPDQVLHWLNSLGWDLLSWTGIRSFYDYMHPEARKQAGYSDVLSMERVYSKKEPWRSMARYQHMICKKRA